MTALKTVETKLYDVFKGLPTLSEPSKRNLVAAWPWIALIFGVLQLLAGWTLWQLTRVTQNLIDLSNTLASLYTAAKPSTLTAFDKAVIYLGILVVIVDGVLLLMACAPLKAHQRRGWELLFLGSLINVAYSVVQLFIVGRGFGSFLFSLVASAIGFYLLFQVRDKYSAKT